MLLPLGILFSSCYGFKGITIPSDLTNIKVLLEKTNLEYKLSIYNENAPVGSDTIPIAKFPVPIQNIFVGKNYTGGQPWS